MIPSSQHCVTSRTSTARGGGRADDIVRVDEDGIYHHLGRADEMVKVKGIFVAPSRVEEALQSIDGIGDAAAMLHRTANDSFASSPTCRSSTTRSRRSVSTPNCGERLPPELVPAVVVRHDELPRTERMKLDRSALEAAAARAMAVVAAAKFTSEFEWWCLAEVRRIIGVDDVGPDDDLFEAGLRLHRCARALRGSHRRRFR